MSNNSGNQVLAGVVFIVVCVLIGFLISRPTEDLETPENVVGVKEAIATTRPAFETNQTIDDEDFGGAVVGMDYPEFRDRLINAGFRPEPIDRTELCADEPDNFQCGYKFSETDYCSGTGEGYCTYFWIKGTDNFTVTTREHEAGEVVGMNYVR